MRVRADRPLTVRRNGRVVTHRFKGPVRAHRTSRHGGNGGKMNGVVCMPTSSGERVLAVSERSDPCVRFSCRWWLIPMGPLCMHAFTGDQAAECRRYVDGKNIQDRVGVSCSAARRVRKCTIFLSGVVALPPCATTKRRVLPRTIVQSRPTKD